MSNQELLDEKFMACTSYSTDILRELLAHGSLKSFMQKYDKKKFRDALIPHQMELFAEPLYLFMILQKKQLDHHKKNRVRYAGKQRQRLERNEEIVSILKELLTGGQLKIGITNISKPYIIHNMELKRALTSSAIDALSDDIERLGLNQFPLPYEKAVLAINNHTDTEWLKDWMESNKFICPNYQSFTLKDFDHLFEKLGMSDIVGAKNKMKQNLIEEYAYDHPEIVLLDKLGVDRILGKIKEVKSRRGRKQETEDIKFIAFILGTLVCLDRFLDDPKINRIEKIDIENKDCRFIHDVMAFFGMIVDRSKTPKNLLNLEKIIRKMLEDVKDPVGIEDMNEKLTILKVELSKKK